MPRFFFPMRDSLDIPDPVGAELPDVAAARRFAADRLHEALVRDDRLWDAEAEWRIDVLDANGASCGTLVIVAHRP